MKYGCIKNIEEFTSYGGIVPIDNAITWRFDPDRASDSMGIDQTLEGTRQAFSLIQPYMGAVKFKEVQTNAEAQIVIGFYKNEDLDEPFNSNTLAYAYLGNGGTAFNTISDVFFNDENFVWGLYADETIIDYIKVATHEILHSLGLGHQTLDSTGILYPSYNPDAPIKFIQDTIDGIKNIYGKYAAKTEDTDVLTFIKGLYDIRGINFLNDLIESEVVYIANYLGIDASTKDLKRETVSKLQTLINK